MEFLEGQVFINSDGSKMRITTVIPVTRWFAQVRFVIIGQETLGEIYVGSKELELGIELNEITLDKDLTEIED